jgi:pSer/pThr/pTyr-binding forkhead associated (FHA) protein
MGRSQGWDIFLDDDLGGRSNVKLDSRAAGFVVVEEGSLNGTFVNRRRVDVQELADGDEIQIGKYKLTFLER